MMGQMIKSGIDPNLVATYRDEGFVRLPSLLSAAALGIVRHCCVAAESMNLAKMRGEDDHSSGAFAYHRSDDYRRMFRNDVDLRFHFPELKPVVAELAVVARELLRSQSVKILWDKTFTKPPLHEGTRQTVWHQDLPFIPVDRRGLLTIWIPCEDVAVETGAMRFVPRSHRIGPIGRIDLVGSEASLDDILTPEDDRIVGKPVTVPLAAGDATVHDGLCIHGSGPNLGQAPRRVWTCIFIPGEAKWTGAPLSHANLQDKVEPFQTFDHPIFNPFQ